MYCYHCMSKRLDDTEIFCTECGNEYDDHIAQSHELPQGTVIGNGRYLIGDCIGAGGFSLTYVGLDLNIDKKILIKETFYNGIFKRNCYNTKKENPLFVSYKNDISLEKIMNKSRKECESLSKAEGLENIVKVYDFFNENNTSYIITEFIDGITLAEKVEKSGRYSWNELYKKMKPLMLSLAELHKIGILHRDIKPENIMIRSTHSLGERFILIDFGLSHSLSAQNQTTLSVAFTPGYAPFEQRNLSGKDGTFIDIYSLAATFYFALTGESPFPGMGADEDENFPKLKYLHSKYGVPKNVENALREALHMNYNLRTQDIASFMKAISKNVFVDENNSKPANVIRNTEIANSNFSKHNSSQTKLAESYKSLNQDLYKDYSNLNRNLFNQPDTAKQNNNEVTAEKNSISINDNGLFSSNNRKKRLSIWLGLITVLVIISGVVIFSVVSNSQKHSLEESKNEITTIKYNGVEIDVSSVFSYSKSEQNNDIYYKCLDKNVSDYIWFHKYDTRMEHLTKEFLEEDDALTYTNYSGVNTYETYTIDGYDTIAYSCTTDDTNGDKVTIDSYFVLFDNSSVEIRFYDYSGKYTEYMEEAERSIRVVK